jgi:hypothetical protein
MAERITVMPACCALVPEAKQVRRLTVTLPPVVIPRKRGDPAWFPLARERQ